MWFVGEKSYFIQTYKERKGEKNEKLFKILDGILKHDKRDTRMNLRVESYCIDIFYIQITFQLPKYTFYSSISSSDLLLLHPPSHVIDIELRKISRSRDSFVLNFLQGFLSLFSPQWWARKQQKIDTKKYTTKTYLSVILTLLHFTSIYSWYTFVSSSSHIVLLSYINNNIKRRWNPSIKRIQKKLCFVCRRVTRTSEESKHRNQIM